MDTDTVEPRDIDQQGEIAPKSRRAGHDDAVAPGGNRGLPWDFPLTHWLSRHFPNRIFAHKTLKGPIREKDP